jgi:hypothetical protein
MVHTASVVLATSVGRSVASMATAQEFTPRIKVVDLGYAPPLSALQIAFLAPKRPFPPTDLLNIGDQFVKGKWGFMNEDCSEARKFSQEVLTELKRLVQHNMIIVLPEFAGGPKLTKKIKRLLRHSKKRLTGGV